MVPVASYNGAAYVSQVPPPASMNVGASVSVSVTMQNTGSTSWTHTSDSDPYRRLNDVQCVCVGEVRAPDNPENSPNLVIDVAELIWEPIAG